MVQQIKSLRYIHEKEIDTIKHILESFKNESSASDTKVIGPDDVKPSTSTDDDAIRLKPIGVISTWFPSKRGTPRQTGICGKVPGKLLLYNSVFTNPDHALEGLQDFSHMWVLFYFHRNDSTHIRAKVAPPRLNGTKTGVFSTRSPHRPCPIGLSLVKITRIENHTIYFEGVDMVDQSPVLDIKPYIPQYDSPLYFEKANNRSQESTNVNDTLESIEDTSRNETISANVNLGDETRNLLSDSYYRKNTNKSNQETDISRDEEIAFRLQAEEFQRNSNFEHYNNVTHFFELSDVNMHNSSILQHNIDVTGIHRLSHTYTNTLSDARSNLNTSTGNNTLSSNLEQQPESLIDINSRLQNINASSHTNVEPTYTPRNNYIETHASRSRLLDGADGPNTVCGTDIDLINRRSLNSRIDNSPIRMGVREAPDGEEGLEPQNLISSQPLQNTQVIRTTSDNSLLDSANTNLVFSSESGNVENRETESNTSSEVRIPDWISRPRTPLCVVFNDRALIQLNEILGTKINDQKVAIENVLREDPRSVYLRQRWGSQFYTFLIHDLHITCRFDDNRGIVTVFQVRHAGRICECGELEWQCLGHSPPPS
ncbi:uncharacterized protein LOC100875268 isoform X2 [Megachile rotundata]|uniref:uncharacterized protein LOC100875268 isoform X2 n=1 Tax=Megachile rotundata TaxID=143995 RepID=UPI0006150B72|nr:PREDICTED: uncharacterized protein LOC100875268 isoform X2 [Megachile rotundata]